MVLSVIVFTILTDDDALGAAITPTEGGNGIFPIIAALLWRQSFFEIIEDRPVPSVRKGAALFDQL